MPDSYCNGLCVTASAIGLPMAGDPVAYPHPACVEHGKGNHCPFCEGWGNFTARETEETRITCPMCNGTGVTDKPGSEV